MYEESLRAFLRPILPLLDDESITEILINSPEDIWAEKKGKLRRVKAKFTPDGLKAAARNMAQYVGKPLDNEHPSVDARLPNGSRICIVMPPIAQKGLTIAIRKFQEAISNMDKLVEYDALTPLMASFLNECVNMKHNIVIAGGTSSGKTTLLNCVSQCIPQNERILTIEDSCELKLQKPHVVTFESRAADHRGKGEFSIRDCLKASLRLRPDRLVIGEIRGGEAFDLIQAMNTGHGGSFCTTHANTPTETLRRLESLALLADTGMPLLAIRSMIAAAIHLIVCCARLPDGTRKVTNIAEVGPLDEKGDYQCFDIFNFVPEKKDEKGKIIGKFTATGFIPTFMDQMEIYSDGKVSKKDLK